MSEPKRIKKYKAFRHRTQAWSWRWLRPGVTESDSSSKSTQDSSVARNNGDICSKADKGLSEDT